jgi:hypothetical protein
MDITHAVFATGNAALLNDITSIMKFPSSAPISKTRETIQPCIIFRLFPAAIHRFTQI